MLNKDQENVKLLLESLQEFSLIATAFEAIRENVSETGVIHRDQAKVLKSSIGELSDSVSRVSSRLRGVNKELFALQPGERSI